MRMRAISRLPSGPSNKQSSTLVEFCEKSEKFTPLPSHVAPSGYGCPSHTSIAFSVSLNKTINLLTANRVLLTNVNHMNPRRFQLTPLEVRCVLETLLRRNSLHLSCSLKQRRNTA